MTKIYLNKKQKTNNWYLYAIIYLGCKGFIVGRKNPPQWIKWTWNSVLWIKWTIKLSTSECFFTRAWWDSGWKISVHNCICWFVSGENKRIIVLFQKLALAFEDSFYFCCFCLLGHSCKIWRIDISCHKCLPRKTAQVSHWLMDCYSFLWYVLHDVRCSSGIRCMWHI